MSRAVVPVAHLNRRVPEQGRIRIGAKSGKAMKALDTFRFTSHDRSALEQIAERYGGEVREWSDPKAAKGQWEVITEASEVEVVLPPDPLGGTPIYELWSGGGCERRCDGLTCSVMVKGPEGPEPSEIACRCVEDGAMICEPHTRLSVILRHLRFGGVWRLESKGWNAAQELPGMVEMVQQMQDQGLPYATLGLQQRRSQTAGETRHYVVPVISLPADPDTLASGRMTLGAGELSPELDEPVPELEAAEVIEAEFGAEDVVDAEIVDAALDELHARADTQPKKNRALKAVVAEARERGVDVPQNFDEIPAELAEYGSAAL